MSYWLRTVEEKVPSNPVQSTNPWAIADVSYATAQLVIEFPSVPPHKIAEAVNVAAASTIAKDGRVLLLKRARDALRQFI